MTNEMKLLKAFIEASGYEIEEVKMPCMPVEAEGRFFGQSYKTDYKVTKKPYDPVEFPFDDGALPNSASKGSIKNGRDQG